MKNKIWIVVFFFVTLLLMLPPRDKRNDGYHSSELTQQTIELPNRTVTVYTDADGKVVKPANGGYSVVVKDKNAAGKDILERYYLTKKRQTFAELSEMYWTAMEQVLLPEEQWGGQYGLQREYNEANECISYTYLNREGKPMNISSGIGTVRQEYDELHRRIKEMYYAVSGEQVTNGSKVWGQAFTYYSSDEAAKGEAEPEEAKPSWLIETVTYLDKDGIPMESRDGYAVVRRFYDENKRTGRECFYDAEGQQAANKLGAYGQDYTYDELGRQITCTYLDRNGNPTICNKGYSKIIRTHFKNNATRTEMYYLTDGSPAVLAHGESGIYEKSTATQLLNAEGKVVPVLDNYLRGNPMLVIVFALLIWVVSSKLSKRWNVALLAAYILFILYMTLLNREFHEEAMKLDFLKTVINMIKHYSTRVQVIENIYLFLPFGVILYYVTGRKWVILVGFLFSIFIEVTQYVTRLGSAEVMDVLTNGLGTALGCFFASVGKRGKISKGENNETIEESTPLCGE